MRYGACGDAVRKSVYCEAFVDLFVSVAAFLQDHEVGSYLDEAIELESVG